MVDAIIAEGGTASFVAADLSNPCELQRLVQEIGPVDVLVNNAGFSWFGPTTDLDVETFRVNAIARCSPTGLPRSASKASCVTGAVIAADGGRTAI